MAALHSLTKDNRRLHRTSDGFWWCYSRVVFGYTLPEYQLQLVTKSKRHARNWWGR